MEETNTFCAIGQFTINALARQLQHSLARVDAIDLDSRMEPQPFTKKSSIPLPYDEHTSRRGDLAETRDATALEVITKGDPLQRPIPGRERVEAHAFVTKNASSGVSRTRSASAVRWSRSILPRKESSKARRSELRLTPHQSPTRERSKVSLNAA